ncbi:MAG: hypothetical protein AB8B53_12510, partial [Flavobacteriales bacterium]
MLGQNCAISDNLIATPAPVNGTYEPGQTVEFCYTLNNWSVLADNWFHSVIPELGPGWDESTLTPTSAADSQDGDGIWLWVNSMTATSGSGNTTGPGFGYDRNGNGNPGDNFGDEDNGPWTFCWQVTVAQPSATACATGTGLSLNMTANSNGDYETGSWGTVACLNDPQETLTATVSCCPLATLGIVQPSCFNVCDGELTVTGEGIAPYDMVLLYTGTNIEADSFNGTSNTETFANLCPGDYTVIVTDADGCPSQQSIELENPEDLSNVQQSLIDCESLVFNGLTYTSSDVVVENNTTANGCPFNVTTNITILPEIPNTINDVTICTGQSYSIGNSTYSVAGSYSDTFITDIGCDSTVITNLTFTNQITHTEYVTTCPGSSYSIGGNTYTTSGTYTNLLQTATGCDSLLTTVLTFTEIETTEDVSVCFGLTYQINGNIYSAPGTYTNVLTTSAGCDSTVTTNLTIIPFTSSSTTLVGCTGETIDYYGQTYTSNAFTTQTINSQNCFMDSTITLSVFFFPPYQSIVDEQICIGESYTINGVEVTETGTYIESFQSIFGCDSTVITNLSVEDCCIEDFTTNSVSICQGDDYSEGTSTYSMSGTYTDVYLNTQGCDSTVTTILTINPVYSVANDIEICPGQTYTEGSSQYTVAGTYTDIYTSALGCDSIVTTNLTVNPVLTQNNDVSICEGDSYFEQGSEYTVAGTYTDTYTSALGCDSVVTTNLTVNSISSIVNNASICEGGTYNEGLSSYNEAGIYIDNYVSIYGCDSIVTTILTMDTQFSTSVSINICDGESYTEGTSVYNTSGTYTDTYTSTLGCDSVVTTILTVSPLYSVTNETSICQGETYNEGTSDYTLAGTYTDVYTSSLGCDSTVTTVLTVIPQFNTSYDIEICEGEFYVEGSSVYIASGIYTDVYPSILGCDSTVTTNLLVNPVPSVTNEVSICQGGTYTEGSSEYTTAGTYTDVYLSALGCDSTVITVLAVDA